MVDIERPVHIKHLQSGILYMWFYTTENNEKIEIHRKDYRPGYLSVTTSDSNKKQNAFIHVDDTFHSPLYNVTFYQEANEVTVVLIPREILREARMTSGSVSIPSTNTNTPTKG